MIYAIVIILLITSPVVYANNFNEYPPYIRLSNSENYDVEKIIDSQNVEVRIKRKNDKNYYSWTFDKSKIGENIDIDFEINFNSENESMINNLAGTGKKKFVSFTHHGILPTEAKLLIYVGDEYKNGELLNLYYYNEELDKIESIEQGIKVNNGYVEFKIDHCSDYFLTTQNLNKEEKIINENVFNMNAIIIGMAIITIVLIVKMITIVK